MFFLQKKCKNEKGKTLIEDGFLDPIIIVLSLKSINGTSLG
tara:strand:+ start:273 stop:395 length:123 start_codon:yes stop_codon:yes gene_type:complete